MTAGVIVIQTKGNCALATCPHDDVPVRQNKLRAVATICTPASHNTTPPQPTRRILSIFFLHHPNRVTRAKQRAMADIIERDEATVIPARGPRRSRLPAPLRVPILVVLNLGINALLWQTVGNFLPPELGYVSKVPSDDDVYSLYSPVARLITKVLTIYATWAVGYDCE
jgi:hypothetical protein